MSVVAILSLVRRYWWAPVILALGIAVAVQRGTISRKNAALQHAGDVMALTVERIQHAQAEAARKDLENARRVEAAQNQASQETAGEYQTSLARAQALAVAYRQRLRDQAAHGGSGGAGQPGAADPSGAVAGAGILPVMDDDDFRVCTENTIRSIAWLAWWKRIQAIPR